MATERLPMRAIRDILRLKWPLQRSHRETARSLGTSPGAVASVVTRATQLGLDWATVEALSEDDLDRQLYGPRLPAQASRAQPDPVWIHTELRRTGVTLELLHLEYLADHPDGYRYSAFCHHYRRWAARPRPGRRASANVICRRTLWCTTSWRSRCTCRRRIARCCGACSKGSSG